MTRYLRPIERPRPRRLESRAEIAAWAAERREVLTRLCREEGLGEFREPEPAQAQLELEEAAA